MYLSILILILPVQVPNLGRLWIPGIKLRSHRLDQPRFNKPSYSSLQRRMGSSHADFSDEIVNALKGSPPVFKHFPPHVPMVSGPTTKTLSQHLSWQKQTRSDKNFSKDIVAALKEPPDGDQSNRKEISQIWRII